MLYDFIQNLYAYNTWANGRVLETAAHLTNQQFLADMQVNFGSVRNALVHLLNVHRVWLSRAQKQPAEPDLSPDDFPDVPALRAFWSDLNARTGAFLDALNEEDLTRVIRYTNARGEPNAYLLWQILFHQANHAAQHRSEIALVLTGLGHSTGLLDYLIFLDQVVNV